MSEKIYSREVARWLFDYVKLLDAECTAHTTLSDLTDSDTFADAARALNQRARAVEEVARRLYDAKTLLLEDRQS